VNDDTNSVTRDRQELGGGMSYLVRPGLGIYGALSRTFATSDENGAGTTISAGVSVLFAGDQTKGRVRP
jgi:hypothetical protein